jgi:hypothetical protein
MDSGRNQRGTYHNKTTHMKLTTAEITATVTVPTICRLKEPISNIIITELKQMEGYTACRTSQFEMQ